MKIKKIIGSTIAAVMMLTCVMTMLPATLITAAESYSIEYLRGDVNGDGILNIVDSMYVNRYLSGKVSADAETLTRMDATQDCVIDMSDYNLVRDYLLNYQSTAMTSSSVYKKIDNAKRSYLKYTFAKQTDQNNQKVDGYILDTLSEIESQPSNRLKKAPANNGVFKDRENINVVRITAYRYDIEDNNKVAWAGTGFVVGKHVIATAAHCLCGLKDPNAENVVFKLATSLEIDIYNENGLSESNRIASFTSDAANGTPDNKTYYKSIKNYHVPRTYREHLLKKEKGKEINVDYALIYVNEDLSDYVWDLGCITDEFKNTHKDITSTGFTKPDESSSENRYYSKGEINPDSERYKLSSKALAYVGQSGGPMYYETSNSGEVKKTVVGITTGGINKKIKLGDEVISEECVGNMGIRITPTLLQFYLNNPRLA